MFEESIMKWLRDWFCGRRTLSVSHRRTNMVRPALEKLEDRRTPSLFGAVSSVTDSAGNSETYDVHTDGTLWGNFNGGQFLQVRGETNVRSVSAGLDNSGLANVFVVHNDGQLTLQNAQTLAGGSPGALLAKGVSGATAEGNGKALIIDNQDFLWQFDPNNGWRMPVDSNGNPEFAGQPSQPLAANFSLLDAHVTQATPLKAQTNAGGTMDTVIALHWGGTLTSDLLQRNVSTPITMNAPNGTGDNMRIIPVLGMNGTAVGGIQSISSVRAPGSPNAFYLYTVSYNGDLQRSCLTSDRMGNNPQLTWQYLGNANGVGFMDVNVGWNSNANGGDDWVATTNTGQVYRDGQLMTGGPAIAFAGPGGSFYEVAPNGTVEQWSPQAHETWVWIYEPPTLNRHGGWIQVPFWTNWTQVDSNVSQT
jgi:hypothetical protein